MKNGGFYFYFFDIFIVRYARLKRLHNLSPLFLITLDFLVLFADWTRERERENRGSNSRLSMLSLKIRK